VVLTTVAFVATVVAAAIWDLRRRRIPNELTFGGVALGLMLRAPEGLVPLGEGLLGVGLALAIAVPLFALGGLGGGDAKLLAAVGAFMGPSRLAGALLLIALVGGVLATLWAARRGVVIPAMLNTLSIMKAWARGQRAPAHLTVASAGVVTIPYGVAIALGATVWWFWGKPLV
jgi:prepilin peptidase CpaA